MVPIIIVWLLGALIARTVLCVKVGVPAFSRLQILGNGGYGFSWLVLLLFKSLLWPLTLALWLGKGRPEPSVLFNERASEKKRPPGEGQGLGNDEML